MSLTNFVFESNRIEGILRRPTRREIEAHELFLKSEKVNVTWLQALVGVLQPDARLRDQPGLDVRVGNHIPPPGGPHILSELLLLIDAINRGVLSAYEAHHRYETLHPFTDGNGRSGRALWLWMMNSDTSLGFLHRWYYQSLQAGRP